ncbi:MAG: MBL fold metallo-hydrolase, partial [Gammaproteobacteria bacterium]|nr:MBL fold metallo-hydrolase [Gammaproteobacteria bacterium]
MSGPDVNAFFDEATFTVSYIVNDAATGRAAIIDPVLDFDPASGRTSTASADSIVAFVNDNTLNVDWILETHVHADHITGAPYLKQRLGGQTAIGRHVTDVQAAFKPIFNLTDLETDGRQFDRLFADGDSFEIGTIEARVISTPGHTPACITYVIGDSAFVGDTLFMPDFGTARTDFPGGSAAELYASIHRILALPADTRLFMCHDYRAPGRDEYA